MANEGLVVDFRESIEHSIRAVEHDLGKGNCKSFEDYKTLCGQIKGMQRARANFNDILKVYRSEE